MQKISSLFSHPLYGVVATRRIEQKMAEILLPHTLMRRAGLSVARLALALSPHARCIWIACGPGNNGGDGFEAALHLHQWGKPVLVTWTGMNSAKGEHLPPDAQASRQRALAAGVAMVDQPPPAFDLCIDALLGAGTTLDPARTSSALIQEWLGTMQHSGALRLSVDVPSGLNAYTGNSSLSTTTKYIANYEYESSGNKIFTLSLLTLKPGLFTADGRDFAGQVWLDDLGFSISSHDARAFEAEPCAWLLGADHVHQRARAQATHASHKGSFGDVAVIGGESSASNHMTGAALLAASAALHAGAGRVFVALLGNASALSADPGQPELMFRSPDALDLDMDSQVIVCGCGGGQSVRSVLAKVLSKAKRLVLDADALNALVTDGQLQTQLKARHGRGYSTVLTPHPLEAARLISCSAAEVQANRFSAVRQLAERFQCVVVLKGSGTLITGPGQPTWVNSTGNALLATAGTGDVLAGLLGAFLAQGQNGLDAARNAVFAHGQSADTWIANQPGTALTASRLAQWQPA